ncbi:MAG: glycosyltransferase [Candidatus Marinimicrobia bacterium]|nr:glycosyltransferase [Candidatus Neomarinimicrobiota bacterium]
MVPQVSIIIPTKKISDDFRQETLSAILNQSYQNFEIILLPDKKTKEKFPQTKIIPTYPRTGPADKRDLGVKKARGEILAFLDGDSYPAKNWLKQAMKIFQESQIVAGVAGPALTPPTDNLCQKASGYVWSTWLGSGGAGTYRCAISQKKEVDDYPTVNLLVRKKDFLAVGGFDSHFWPGEDTKLCLDLTKKLKKKIIYHPQVLVYHHRREVFGPHLKQISRYAIHRGHFARVLPETSFRLGYLFPTLFALGLVFGLGLSFFHPVFLFIYFSVLGIYFFALLFTAIQVYQKEKSLSLALLVMPSIFVTHVVYGFLFIKGFFSPKLKR